MDGDTHDGGRKLVNKNYIAVVGLRVGEEYFKPGAMVSLSDDVAKVLLSRGIVLAVPLPEKETKKPAAKTKTAKTKKE